MKVPTFSPLLAWITCAAAVIAWLLVIVCAFSVNAAIAGAQSDASAAQSASMQRNLAARTHTFATVIAPLGVQLQTYLGSDALAIAGMITKAGRDAGVALSLSNAAPDTTAAAAHSGNPAVSAITVTISGSGSFTALMHAAMLLENLPIPSALQNFDIGKTGDAGSPWRLDAGMRALTSQTISS
ncbi:MAG TPA: hypothetical protein VN495_00490 [Candidatus Paceibacterota bacterium]|nr:hypothetical protein [Candidatus Paceibacterota bacterium]